MSPSTIVLIIALCSMPVVAQTIPGPSDSQKQTLQEVRGTKGSPVFVTVIPADKTPEQAKQEDADRAEKRAIEDQTIKLTEQIKDFTGYLVAVGILQAAIFLLQLGVFGYQGRQLKRTVDSSESAARPILAPRVVGGAKGLYPDKAAEMHTPRLVFMLENHGKTPAILKELRYELRLLVDLPTVPLWEHPTIRNDRNVISGEARWGEEKMVEGIVCKFTKSLSRDEIMEATRKIIPGSADIARRFFFFGRVIYDDVFGDRHTRGFCLKIFQNGSQAVRGSSAYNYSKREKIPRQDEDKASDEDQG